MAVFTSGGSFEASAGLDRSTRKEPISTPISNIPKLPELVFDLRRHFVIVSRTYFHNSSATRYSRHIVHGISSNLLKGPDAAISGWLIADH
jgi:hypothetical protein